MKMLTRGSLSIVTVVWKICIGLVDTSGRRRLCNHTTGKAVFGKEDFISRRAAETFLGLLLFLVGPGLNVFGVVVFSRESPQDVPTRFRKSFR
jgi:hypothetical protein